MVILKVYLLLSAGVAVLAAPTDSGSAAPTDSGSAAPTDSGSAAPTDSGRAVSMSDQDMISSEDPIIKKILEKLDVADLTEAMNEQAAIRTKTAAADSESKEVKTPEIGAKNDAKSTNEDSKIKNLETAQGKSDVVEMLESLKEGDKVSTIKTSEITQEKSDVGEKLAMIDNDKVIKMIENKDISNKLDSRLKDVASAVAEAVTSLPVPLKPDSPSKYTEVIGHFISELLQIPMVLLHAVSNAIASLTNNKVNIPSPPFIGSVAPTPPPL